MTHRQQKLPPALRITAAGCIGLWLLAASCCHIGFLCSDDHHAKANAPETVAHHESGHSQEAEAAEHAHGEASHPHDSEQSSRDSHPCEGGDSCCSTLMATAQNAKPFNAPQPLLESLNLLCPVLLAREPMLAAPEARPLRQAKDRDLVLTPVVCLGPAHRSLAPPASA